MTTATKPVTYRWRATKADGVAHLFPTRGSGSALCGAANQDERFDHPRGRRCPTCDERQPR